MVDVYVGSCLSYMCDGYARWSLSLVGGYDDANDATLHDVR